MITVKTQVWVETILDENHPTAQRLLELPEWARDNLLKDAFISVITDTGAIEKANENSGGWATVQFASEQV